ncbi:uroporphyrinogen-III synthase [Acinetobacter sp. MB5]|uniref:uroporphyrinogen-III synthase n=1 Tax=Acinetobacter sp. MB5 TaxID=2069438 RepID=UPI000DCFD58C|nr:uroporphyrinogen-III synthase [Acinetobacter sp. MB5]
MILLNTRPVERAHSLTQIFIHDDIEVIELPLLELTALPYSADLAQLYRQLSDTQVIVVVSPTAVDVGMQYLQASQIEMSSLANVQWIAVGQATAQRLKDYGISASIPEVETSEGMLQLPILQNLALRQVAFWRGLGGRQFMMESLQQQGIHILNFVLYQRRCPQTAIEQFQQLSSRLQTTIEPVYVCISSEASWLNWMKLCENNPEILSKCQYLTLGERLTQLLQHQQITGVQQLESLNPQSIRNFLLKQKGTA